MKQIRYSFIAGLLVLLLPAGTGWAAGTAPGEKLYVAIDYFNPIQFELMRYSWLSGEEIILNTLKATAAAQARAAGYTGELAVLEENAQAPEGAAVLRLTWVKGGNVTADLTQNGRNQYLGVVNRTPIAFHPDHDQMQRRLNHALLAEEHRDMVLRVATEMDLFVALRYVVKYESKATPS